jgi:hypothetical protein
MLTTWNLEKSTGSGAELHVPPKKSGNCSWSHSVAQPPDECPCRNRPRDSLVAANLLSRNGMNSVTSAVPHGPFTSVSANDVWPNLKREPSVTRIMGVGQRPACQSAPIADDRNACARVAYASVPVNPSM